MLWRVHEPQQLRMVLFALHPNWPLCGWVVLGASSFLLLDAVPV